MIDVDLLYKRVMIFSSLGCTAEEFGTALRNVTNLLPPLGEREIDLIERNPSLNWFQKKRLIRKTRKGMVK